MFIFLKIVVNNINIRLQERIAIVTFDANYTDGTIRTFTYRLNKDAVLKNTKDAICKELKKEEEIEKRDKFIKHTKQFEVDL